MQQDSRTFSARWKAEVIERLRRRSDAVGISRSRLAERYVDEGVRMDQHPGIVFRDGPSGRRAALAGGPDAWEVIATIKMGKTRGEKAISAAADALDLSSAQVQAALAYYGDYPDEVDERVRRNLQATDAAEAAWERLQPR